MSGNLLRLVVSFASVDKLSGSLKGIVGLAQSGSERLAGMKREARNLERELHGVQTELGQTSGNVTALLDRETALRARIARTNDEMAKQVRLLKIQSQVDAIQAKGEQFKTRGQQNMFAGAAMLAPLIIAGKGAAEFQSGMTDIALKAELGQKETARLAANILKAARSAKQLPESMRSGVDVLAGFGMTPQDAVKMIGPIGKVATAYKAEISDLAAASFANFSNLKVPIRDNARALEIMAAAGNAGAFEIKDMAQYFPTLTALAQSYGQTGVGAVADLAAAAQIARKGTGDAASAATNLQNLLSKINTKETITKFKKMGVDLPAALKKAYAQGQTPLEAIANIVDKTLHGKLDRISFLFGDMQAQQALRPLIQNMDEYRRIRADALASKGAIDTAFARRSQDASTQAQALVGNLQRLAIILGPILLPPFVKITELALKVTDRFASWAQANPRLASALLTTFAAVATLRIGLGALQFLFGSLLGPFGKLFGLIMRSGPLVAGAFGVMRTAALFLGRGLLQAGAMMLANPIVLIIVAIAAAVGAAGYLIWKYWDKIKAAFWMGVAGARAALGWLKNTTMAGLGAMRDQAGQWVDAGRHLLAGFARGIQDRVDAVKTMIKGIAGKVTGWFKGVLGIKSPSRVFMGLGRHITAGLALGIAGSQGTAIAATQTMADKVAGIAPKVSIAATGGIDRSPLTPLAPARAPRSAGKAGAPSQGKPLFGDVYIDIKAAPGQSARDIAAEVKRALDAHAAAAQATARSGFRDDDDEE